MPPCGTPYKAVLHAVAVDGFYASSSEVVRDLGEASLARAAMLGARRVALTALATGYGRLGMQDFANAIAPLRTREWPPIGEVVICVRSKLDAEALSRAFHDTGAVVTDSARL